MTLEPADSAPDFELIGSDGDELQQYRLTEYIDDGPVVLAFYPADFSPVCTEELCALHEGDYFTFVPDVDLFGISPDGVYSHQAFIDEHGFGFPLLSDGDKDVADAYGVLTEQPHEQHNTYVIKRSLFIVDTDRTVRYAWVTDDPHVQPDLLEAKRRLDEIAATA